MIPFDYERPADVASAVAAVRRNPNAMFLAGGTNLVDHLKLGVAGPELLVDVSGLPLDEVAEQPDGRLRVGAAVRNSDLAAHPLVRRRFPVLAEALLAGASGQLRNAATTGGNLLQRTRCPYFQDISTPCNKRSPGAGCSAIGGHHRDMAVLGSSEHCVAAHPSDMAVAMSALGAVVRIQGMEGERSVELPEFHRLPGDEPHRDTVLQHGELITAVDLPGSAPRSTYRKVRDRASFAFALVSVAAVLEVEDGAVREVRLALGGVAHKPWRATRAEEVLRGGPAEESAFRAAAEEELADARPLAGNAFKVPLARKLITGVLRDLADQAGEER